MASNENVLLYIESPDGQRFECEVSSTTQLSKLAYDFFEERGWPRTDGRGRSQRAVLDLVDPEKPDRTKRLRGEQNVGDAGLWNGATLRVFPESIAGVVSEDARIKALTADYNELTELTEWNKHIKFEGENYFNNVPTIYKVSLNYPSFVGLKADGHTPIVGEEHRCEIELGAGYPREAPRVRWLTPIFHPNINADKGMVCLGILMDRYLPGLGLSRLVTMLAEMVQWRNFDATNCFNAEAGQWAVDPDHWDYIYQIGGSPFQGPVQDFLDDLASKWGIAQPLVRITFKPIDRV
ncbi:MAG TPA: ubiquitin-conjugating enzyme E2 [Pyrinomonadaceae bacterium]|nr:ubiquitin-conjugating enzyme E2 [Pyrinomonadaceae bacterium]